MSLSTLTLPTNPPPLKAQAKSLDFYYGDFKALKSVSMPVYENKVTALIGPSGCGKSTFLRCFNRMHDLYPGHRYDGQIDLLPDAVNLLAHEVDPIEVRMRISMVFQKPNPFPKSIFENVAYGLRVRGVSKAERSATTGVIAFGVIGAGPDRHWRHRRTDRRDQEDRVGAHRHPQHAASGTGVRLRGLYVPGRVDRVWRDTRHLHEAQTQRDRGLHHRPLWLIPGAKDERQTPVHTV